MIAAPPNSDKKTRNSGFFSRLGPGLITGASDDDPSGIGTYSQAGAAFGYGLLWTLLFSLPLMLAIQEISARIGRVTGHGIAGNLGRHYSAWILYPTVLLLLIANTINLGADLGAMGDALALIFGGPPLLYCILAAGVSVVLQVFVHYKTYNRYLKWLTIVLFSYVATAFMVHVSWFKAFHGLVVPSFSRRADYWATFIAILGTTISPYLFFWQASQETEEIKSDPEQQPLKVEPGQAHEELGRIRFDTAVGMVLSNMVAFFIILCAAATLSPAGITTIDTSAQAAQALRPLAGPMAFIIFTLGIVGTGLLAVPVLAGSAAYAVGEALRIPCGLDKKPSSARGFYFTLTSATLIGLAINFPVVQKHVGITPIRALFWSAVLNGIIAVPIMAVLMRMACNQKVMGKFALRSVWLNVLGWISVIVMGLAVFGMIVTAFMSR